MSASDAASASIGPKRDRKGGFEPDGAGLHRSLERGAEAQQQRFGILRVRGGEEKLDGGPSNRADPHRAA